MNIFLQLRLIFQYEFDVVAFNVVITLVGLFKDVLQAQKALGVCTLGDPSMEIIQSAEVFGYQPYYNDRVNQ